MTKLAFFLFYVLFNKTENTMKKKKMKMRLILEIFSKKLLDVFISQSVSIITQFV